MKKILLPALLLLLGYNAQAQCTAAISVTTSGNVATLTNTSTPASVGKIYTYYAISWGDGLYSYPTTNTSVNHSYFAGGTYTVKLVQRVIDSTILPPTHCNDTDSVNITVTGKPCATQGTAGINFHPQGYTNNITFTAINVNNTPNMTFAWSFGDGNTGSGSPIVHSYVNTGTYNAKVVGTNGSCRDSFIIPLLITKVPPPPPSGEIFGDISGIDSLSSTDSVKIWLIKYDSSTTMLKAIDSQVSPRMAFGYAFYRFVVNTAGNYRVKAAKHKGATSGTGTIPTYHDSALVWNAATVLAHAGYNTSTRGDIYMRKGTLTSGPGFVGGNVNQGANKGTAAGIADLTIFLLDANGQPQQYATTDANGYYCFSNVAAGTYSIHPEYMGYITTTATFTVTATNTKFNSMNFERSNKNKTIYPVASGIANVNSNKLAYTIFPNPAHDAVMINWGKLVNLAADVRITDVNGKIVYSNSMNMSADAKVNVCNLQAGMYFISVTSEAGNSTQKLIIQ